MFLSTWDSKGAKECKSCRSRKMLQNASLLAIVADHTAENEPSEVGDDAEASVCPIQPTQEWITSKEVKKAVKRGTARVD